MEELLQLFDPASQALLRSAFLDRGREAILWYPSAGGDLREVRRLESNAWANPSGRRLAYVYNDMLDPTEENGYEPFPEGARIVGVQELAMRNPLRHVSRAVCSFGASQNTGRVYLFELAVDCGLDPMRNYWSWERDQASQTHVERVPLLYFVAENMSFLVNILLAHRIPIDTLVHIRDGGGTLGGSRMPCLFLYEAVGSLQVRKICSHYHLRGTEKAHAFHYALLAKEILQSGHDLPLPRPVDGDRLRSARSAYGAQFVESTIHVLVELGRMGTVPEDHGTGVAGAIARRCADIRSNSTNSDPEIMLGVRMSQLASSEHVASLPDDDVGNLVRGLALMSLPASAFFRILIDRQASVEFLDTLSGWVLARCDPSILFDPPNYFRPKDYSDYLARREYYDSVAKRHFDLIAITKPDRETRRQQKAFAASLRHSPIRKDLIERLKTMSLEEQLDCVVQDQKVPPNFYPAWIPYRASRAIDEIPLTVKEQLLGKLQGRQRGPWRAFKSALTRELQPPRWFD